MLMHTYAATPYHATRPRVKRRDRIVTFERLYSSLDVKSLAAERLAR
jgi:hypothetical protein